MTTITLHLDRPGAVDPAAALPRRVRLSRVATERVAQLTDCPLPWATRREPSSAQRRLGPALPPGRPAPADADRELRELGLLDAAGDLFPELPAAMAAFGSPDVLVDLEVSVRRPGGFAQLRSWQRRRNGRVTTMSTAGGPVELGWFPEDLWHAELARAVTVAPTRAGGEPPTGVIDLPHELLLGGGEAIRLGREDVLAELVRRHTGDVVCAGVVAEQVRLLHTSSVGRMRTVVSGIGTSGARKTGWVSWSLFPDGWRALTPYVREAKAMVRVHPVGPLRLGIEVARLASGVQA